MNSHHHFFFLALMMVLAGISGVHAQEGTPQPGDPSTLTIHVVQRDETLSEIALQYGVTLDSIITANSILDPDNLVVGQRLIIPNPRVDSPGMIITHTVQPGETLQTLVVRYNSTLESISRLNYILHTKSLYIGQKILIAEGAAGTLPPANHSLVIVQPGDTLIRIALRHNMTIFSLLEANNLDPNAPLQVGQALIIPSTPHPRRFVNLPPPMIDFQLDPLPAIQGHTLSAQVVTQGNTTVSGSIFDRAINFTQEGELHHAMIGIHAFTEPGIYIMAVQITDEDGLSSQFEARIYIESGAYGSEQITLSAEQSSLLAPEIVAPELERITTVMSGFTPQRYFKGLASLPAAGSVVSPFGTRRSYDGGEYNAFHGGADLAGAHGAVVMAAADGVVVLAETLPIRGNAVILDHGWGVYTGYWHQDQITVTVGQTVQRGEGIGTVGSTGLSTGPHLHWEMWVGGVQVDPLQWVSHAFFP